MTPCHVIGHQMLLFYSPVLITGCHAKLLVTRRFTASAMGLKERYLPLGTFYFALLPAFQGFPGADSSTSKLAGLHTVVRNIVPDQLLFESHSNPQT